MKIAVDLTWLNEKRTGVDIYFISLLSSIIKLDKANHYILLFLKKHVEMIESNRAHNLKFLGKDILNIVNTYANVSFAPINLPGRVFHKVKLYNIPIFRKIVPRADVYLFPAFVSWPFVKGKKIVFVYDLSFERFPQFGEDKMVKIYKNQVPKSTKMADSVVTISEFSKREIITNYKINENKVNVVYPASSDIFMRKIPLNLRRSVAVKYSLINDYLLYVGTIEPRKNILGVVKAFEKVGSLREYKSLDLVIAGKIGWKSDDTINYINSSSLISRIKVLSYVPLEDLPGLYLGAKVFVYPSFYEGFGLPVLEAMTLGVPVVTSSNSSLVELARGASVLVDPNDYQDIASAIIKTMSNRSFSKKITHNGKLRSKDFSWEKSSKKLLDIIEGFSNNYRG